MDRHYVGGRLLARGHLEGDREAELEALENLSLAIGQPARPVRDPRNDDAVLPRLGRLNIAGRGQEGQVVGPARLAIRAGGAGAAGSVRQEGRARF